MIFPILINDGVTGCTVEFALGSLPAGGFKRDGLSKVEELEAEEG